MTNTAYDEQPGTATFHAYGTRFNYLTSSDQSYRMGCGWLGSALHGAGPDNNNTAGRCDDDCSIPPGMRAMHGKRLRSVLDFAHTKFLEKKKTSEGDEKRMQKQQRENSQTSEIVEPPATTTMTRWSSLD
jgi:hypothetical protein